MTRIFFLLVGILISNTGLAQFYIGCDSLIEKKPYGYRPAPNTLIGNMVFYQDSLSNQFLLVSDLGRRKIIHPFYYQVMKDSITSEDYLLLKRYKTVKAKLNNKKQISDLKGYRNFVKINPAGYSDSAFLTQSEYINDGIDALEDLWHVTDKDIPCDLYIDLKRNNPRHSNISYYYLDFDSPCLSAKPQSLYKDDD